MSTLQWTEVDEHRGTDRPDWNPELVATRRDQQFLRQRVGRHCRELKSALPVRGRGKLQRRELNFGAGYWHIAGAHDCAVEYADPGGTDLERALHKPSGRWLEVLPERNTQPKARARADLEGGPG